MKKEKIKEAQFDFSKKNTWTALWTNPFYFMRKNLYFNIKELAPKLSGMILDFGCGAKPYRDLFINCDKYIGLDIETSGHDHKEEFIDVYYDGNTIPFKDEHFDNIFSSEVYEHVVNIDDILQELYRVLKKDGLMLVTVPFVWNEHETPYDFHRYTGYGIKELLEKHGFEVIESRKSTSYIEMIYQMRAEYYRDLCQNINSKIRRKLINKIVIPFQIIKGLVLSKTLPKTWSFYGDNIVLCKKLK